MKTILIFFMASLFGMTDPCVEEATNQNDQVSVELEQFLPDCEEVHYAEPLDCPNGQFGSVSYLVTNCYIGKRLGWRILVRSDTVQVSLHPCQPIFDF